MQRLRFALQVSLLMAVAALTLGAMGSMSFGAGDAFDEDYTDCPSNMRLEAVSGLKVTRTSEDDELKVTWEMADPASWGLGNRYRAEIAVIVEGSGDAKEKTVALGRNEVTFDGIDFASNLDIEVAVVRDDYVISNIAAADFKSGLAAPKFSSPFYLAKSTQGDIFRDKLTDSDGNDEPFDADDNPRALANLFNDDGKAITDRASVHAPGDKTSTFYYLGFNQGFDNWYSNPKVRNSDPNSGNARYPRTPKFRIGLRHGSDDPDADPDAADFDHFRIRIADSSGDDVLGFDAATVADSVYDGRVLVLGNVQDESTSNPWLVDESEAPHFATIKRSNRVEAPVEAYYVSAAAFWRRYLDPALDVDTYGAQVKNRAPRLHSRDSRDAEEALEFKLSSHNLLRMRNIGGFDATPRNQRQLFALPPVEIYDMAPDAFGKDGHYTFAAWAEDSDGHQISPKASITLNIRERFKDAARSNHMLFKSPPIYPDHVATNEYHDIGMMNVNAVVLDLAILAD